MPPHRCVPALELDTALTADAARHCQWVRKLTREDWFLIACRA
jgi:hypothetical protein